MATAICRTGFINFAQHCSKRGSAKRRLKGLPTIFITVAIGKHVLLLPIDLLLINAVFFLLFYARWNWTNPNGTSQVNKIQIAATHLLHSQCAKHLRGSWILLSLSWYVCSYPSTTKESGENPIAWLFCNSILQSMHFFDFILDHYVFFCVEPSTCYIRIACSNTFHFFLFDSLLMRLMLQRIGE